MFGWLRTRRRRAILTRPFPAAWLDVLRRNVRQTAWLDEAHAERHRALTAVFVAEKRFEGCLGLEITDEIRVTIAGQAALVALGFDDEHFDRLRSVLVYPGDYLAPKSAPLEGGGELQWQEQRLGETWAGGSMVLSWPRASSG